VALHDCPKGYFFAANSDAAHDCGITVTFKATRMAKGFACRARCNGQCFLHGYAPV
jgi:hypothetical protein